MNNNIVIRESCSEIRALARGALRGNWQKAITVGIVYMLLFTTVSAILEYLFPVVLVDQPGAHVEISYAQSLYQFFTAGAFTYGYIAFSLSLFRKKEAHVGQLFEGFERILKVVGLTIVMAIFVMLWSLLFIIPGIIAAYRYSQAFNVMYDHPEYGILQCIAESKRIMQGNKMKLFLLSLSYCGWMFLSALPMALVSGIYGATRQVVGETTLTGLILENITVMFMVPVTAYMMMGEMAFYELASGHLVREEMRVEPLTHDPITKIVEDVKQDGTETDTVTVSLTKKEDTAELQEPEQKEKDDIN